MARRKTRNHKQKLYKMKGCSKSRRNTCKNKKYLGGANPYLAYPYNNVKSVPNPYLAYTGGKQVYPAKAPPPLKGDFFINPPYQRGGTCAACSAALPILKGGGNIQRGGTCAACSAALPINIQGGGGCGNNGIPYPNGLVGSGWSINHTPGTGVAGDYNHFKFNPQDNNPQLQMIANGANRPFTVGGGRKKSSKKNIQKGGVLDNFIFQDFVNLGRQVGYGLGSAYNTVAGYPAPVNPLPWKGQLPNNPYLQINKPVSL